MPELEAMIEKKLIEQLVYGESQWTYREDLKNEEDLWKNFKYILEQNNKERLNGESLSNTEFEQVKNQLQFSSFYKAGEWLVGENGKVQVHVQRDTERLHLVVLNHEHIAGGSSVYEVINQYSALKSDDEKVISGRDRRFDVTLMINGLPMIHIELKNKQHSYMDGFWQIKKYIGEGKFTGIFSAVQMFVISNGVDTKYFSAASDTELNPKFISGWLDRENNPVSDYLDFAKSVLRIPEAHEMISRYTVLDEDAKRLILLRPYQIHAIEAIREAVLFKEAVDNAVKLYSAGGTKEALMAEWNEVEPAFRKALAALRVSAEKPEEIPAMSLKEKKIFAKMFQAFDSMFAQLKSFTIYDDSMLEEYGISEEEYDDYVGHYKNVVQEIKEVEGEKTDGSDGNVGETDIEIDQDYELMAYSNTKIDYEYIINLIQNIVMSSDEEEEITSEERQKKIDEVKQYVEDLRKENPKVADLMSNLIEEIERDDTKYRGQSILHIVENMKQDCIERMVSDFCVTWYASKDDVMYAATHYQNGEILNESAIKMTVDYTSYKSAQEKALPKFKYYTKMMAELRKLLDEEIKPLLIAA